MTYRDWHNLVKQCKDWLEYAEQNPYSELKEDARLIKSIFNRELRGLRKMRKWTQRMKRMVLDLVLER